MVPSVLACACQAPVCPPPERWHAQPPAQHRVRVTGLRLYCLRLYCLRLYCLRLYCLCLHCVIFTWHTAGDAACSCARAPPVLPAAPSPYSLNSGATSTLHSPGCTSISSGCMGTSSPSSTREVLVHSGSSMMARTRSCVTYSRSTCEPSSAASSMLAALTRPHTPSRPCVKMRSQLPLLRRPLRLNLVCRARYCGLYMPNIWRSCSGSSCQPGGRSDTLAGIREGSWPRN
mmetsp:Transcript_34045/g.75497  ORF Transcript_34045/g.75497 Transcript_34045/m.75497 type:complete len:231 (+) Transcript_34045:424-1116(+)